MFVGDTERKDNTELPVVNKNFLAIANIFLSTKLTIQLKERKKQSEKIESLKQEKKKQLLDNIHLNDGIMCFPAIVSSVLLLTFFVGKLFVLVVYFYTFTFDCPFFLLSLLATTNDPFFSHSILLKI